MRGDKADGAGDFLHARFYQALQHHVERNIDAVVLRPPKARARDGDEPELHLGLQLVAHGRDVIPHDLGAARADHEQGGDGEVLCFTDGPGKNVLAAMHDLVHAEFRAHRHRLHVVALLRSKGVVDQVIAPLRRMGEQGGTGNPESSLGGAVEGTPEVGVRYIYPAPVSRPHPVVYFVPVP